MKTCRDELVKLLDIADKLEEAGMEAEAKELRIIEKGLLLEVTVITEKLKGIIDKIKTDK